MRRAPIRGWGMLPPVVALSGGSSCWAAPGGGAASPRTPHRQGPAGPWTPRAGARPGRGAQTRGWRLA